MRKTIDDKTGLHSIVYVFRPIWDEASDTTFYRDVNDPSVLFADVLSEYHISYDDRCQFCRLFDFEQNIQIEIRAYNLAKIVVNVHELDSKFVPY